MEIDYTVTTIYQREDLEGLHNVVFSKIHMMKTSKKLDKIVNSIAAIIFGILSLLSFRGVFIDFGNKFCFNRF